MWVQTELLLQINFILNGLWLGEGVYPHEYYEGGRDIATTHE